MLSSQNGIFTKQDTGKWDDDDDDSKTRVIITTTVISHEEGNI